MYIVTFYAFKGGTGRTMALVNVGAELARTGARVLLVDFDLEAPSLMNFNLAGTTQPCKGIVDFVLEYQKTNVAPQINDFICQSESFPESSGRIWIMPAGSRGSDYKHRLAQIDWQDLYRNRDGYLLIEELKAQWHKYLEPDYVLIDSRTGHNEVMGICTRQLPNAVCAVFVPNRQNLGGLCDVVGQVRRQAKNSSGSRIAIHFVVSNVPQVDDESGTLETALIRYRKALEIPHFDATIHHHPALTLQGHDVFVLKQRRSTLTDEYRHLADVIRSPNLEDSVSALKYLRDLNAAFRGAGERIDSSTIENSLATISRVHADDSEVMYWLARTKRQLGAAVEAAQILNQIIDRGGVSPHVYLERASLRLREADGDRLTEARRDFTKALEHLAKSPNYRDVTFAVQSLIAIGQDVSPDYIASLEAISGLTTSEQVQLCSGLDTSDLAVTVRYLLLKKLSLVEPSPSADLTSLRANLSLSCIRLNKFPEAVSILRPHQEEPEAMSVSDSFNLGMALWGLEGRPSAPWFNRVLALAGSNPRGDANYAQCIALSAWVVGERREAELRLASARTLARDTPSLHFSAWRYLRVSTADFENDLDQMSELFSGRNLPPAFIQGR